MRFKIDNLIPVLVIGALAFLFLFNNKTPVISPGGNIIIKPEHKLEMFRDFDIKGSLENDNKVIITNLDSDQKLTFLMKDNFLLLPDGEFNLPTKKDINGKEVPLWKIEHIKRDIFFDLGWDFGTYAGYISDVPEDQNRIKEFDVGLRFSPLRVYNSFATDILISSQDAGLGISFYPLPIRYGYIWNHLGLGYGKMVDYDKKEFHNLFYLSFSTRF